MANELIKTLTIDGTSLDTLGVGRYCKLDSGYNRVNVPFTVVKSISVTQSVSNNSIQDYEMWTSPITGMAIISAMVAFPTNSTGVRYIGLRSITDNKSAGAVQRVNAASSGDTSLSVCARQRVQEGQKMGIRVYQNSGSALSCQLQLFILYVEA